MEQLLWTKSRFGSTSVYSPKVWMETHNKGFLSLILIKSNIPIYLYIIINFHLSAIINVNKDTSAKG